MGFPESWMCPALSPCVLVLTGCLEGMGIRRFWGTRAMGGLREVRQEGKLPHHPCSHGICPTHLDFSHFHLSLAIGQPPESRGFCPGLCSGAAAATVQHPACCRDISTGPFHTSSGAKVTHQMFPISSRSKDILHRISAVKSPSFSQRQAILVLGAAFGWGRAEC